MADPIIINLSVERIEEGEFQNKSRPDERFRQFLASLLNPPLIKFEIVGITHGKLTGKGDLATLLSFEFRFATGDSQRFSKVSVALIFEDAEEQTSRDPVVHAISPEGSWAINKTEMVRNVKYGAGNSANEGIEALGAEAGTLWRVERLQSREVYTALTGVKRIMRKNWAGEDNVANWILKEDEDKEDGVPTFMRAAVLLRRPKDLPFTFKVKVETDVAFIGAWNTLFGLERINPIDPVRVDPGNLPGAGRAVLKTLDPKTYNLQEMDTLDLGEAADVAIFTLRD